ncbi:DUF1579 domain-containing protein [Sphingoaurantiacus capsulatus]|uniref:DUF1579 domain-containing protein n=1 Tax=Sphingoaurantiacus capsulatus TaxID=1771310 RepID=A0ABV7X5U4_9SPHN
MTDLIHTDRRETLLIALGLAAAALVPAAAGAAPAADTLDPAFAPHAKDWAWLVGNWAVKHRKLRERLVNSNQWDSFDGTCTNWPVLGGQGNVDDNLLDMASGAYRGVGVRTFDTQTKLWAIWWIDSRTHGVGEPVRGGFRDGVGTFVGDDVHKGTKVKVRFRWSKITPTSAHWEQAFSVDGGKSWEDNWHMDFVRTA